MPAWFLRHAGFCFSKNYKFTFINHHEVVQSNLINSVEVHKEMSLIESCYLFNNYTEFAAAPLIRYE